MPKSIFSKFVQSLHRVIFGLARSQYRVAASSPRRARDVRIRYRSESTSYCGPFASVLLSTVGHRTVPASHGLPVSLFLLRVHVALFSLCSYSMSDKIPFAVCLCRTVSSLQISRVLATMRCKQPPSRCTHVLRIQFKSPVSCVVGIAFSLPFLLAASVFFAFSMSFHCCLLQAETLCVDCFLYKYYCIK